MRVLMTFSAEVLGPSLGIGPVSGDQHSRTFGSLGDSPNGVDRPAGLIVLKNQHAGAFDVVGIILHHDGFLNTGENLTCQDAIRSQFIVAMI